jgi:hypothetical protein
MTGVINLDQLATLYDEHEQRTAAYLGRPMSNDERVSLGIQALNQVLKNRTIKDYERAADLMDAEITGGASVGSAVRAAIVQLDGGVVLGGAQ